MPKRFIPILAVLGGLCAPLALAPFNYYPLMAVSLAVFFWLSYQAKTVKQGAWYGWLYGAGFFSLGVSWIYGSMATVDTPVWLALVLTGGFCLLMALFHLIQMAVFVRWFRALPFNLVWAAPLWWVTNEWFREWFLTGMPWLYAGYAWIATPVAQLAAVGGIYGLSLILALAVAWELWLWQAGRLKSWQHGGVVLVFVAFGLGWLLPADGWTTPTRDIQVAAIQSNIDQKTKWTGAQQRPTLEFFGNSLAGLSEPDLILWPEAAMTRLEHQIPSFLGQVEGIATQRDQAVITGILTLEDGRYYNSMKGFGTADGVYRKQHLVPFGEYVPLEDYLRGLIAFFDLPMSTMLPAQTPQYPLSLSLAGEPYFAAPVICYEAAYPEIVRELAREANLITVISNDAWFGDSLGPHQHLQITQMRAIENGRPILRATQNGISALIDANGQILSKTEQFVEAELLGQLTLRQGLTPFQRVPAHLIPWLAIALLTGVRLFFALRKPPATS